jgi:hypothetical protein
MTTTVDEYGNIVDDGDTEFMNFMTGAAGDQEFTDFMTQAAEENSGIKGFVNSAVATLGDGAKDFLKKYLYDPKTQSFNPAGIATAASALYGLMGGNTVQTGGYNKPIPKLTATREQIPYAANTNRRPGEAGRSYFTDTQYTAPEAAAAAQAAAKTQAQGIASAMPQRTAQVNPFEGQYKPAWNPPAQTTQMAQSTPPASGVAQLLPVPNAQEFKPMAAGGLAAGGFVVPADVVAHLGNGSSSAGLALLAEKLNAKPIKGDGDGMSDSIPTHIDGKEKALVANDEAYIEPEMVAKLGGSEKLYAMMDKIRKARTGTTEQGKKINPEKFMPGGIAQLAGGGAIKRFVNDGAVPAAVTSTTPLGTSTSSSLSPWAGDYVTNYLGKGQALAEAPYQSYGGPLTAGASDLQQQAFAGIGSLAGAGYTPQTYQGGTFGADQAQQYMNPYLSAALNPQLAEMRRQADIGRVADAGRMTQSGAFGGSRQAIMESEGNRNLMDKQNQAIGQGYQTAYDKAMQQFNTEQDRRLGAEKAGESSRQYSADFGLKSLGEAASLGAVQRGIDTEGINADRQQFEEQRDYPLKMVQYQKDLLQGLPITSAATTANTTGISQLSSQILGLQGLYNQLAGLGQTKAA